MVTKNIFRYLITLILLGSTFQGCDPDSTEDHDVDPAQEKGTIGTEFKRYIDRFIAEMNQRGRNLSTDRLSVVFVDRITMPNSDRFCAYGYVNFQNSGNPRVEVINTKGCWGRWSETEKENLMFHELGHALLGKGHINGTLPNGSQRSLMCASETCNNYRVYNTYQIEQRSYYLDQLANEQNMVPDWAAEKAFSRLVSEDSFDYGIEEWTTAIGENANSEMPYDFYTSEKDSFSPPNALSIKSVSATAMKTSGHWQKTFPISDFESCSTLLIRADIFTKNLVEGSVGIAIDLLEKSSSNEFEFFARYSNALRTKGVGPKKNERFETKVICIPKETAAIRVLLYMNQVSENTMATFDNLEIELME